MNTHEQLFAMHLYYAYFLFVKTESTMWISSKQYKVNTLNSKIQIQFTICRDK